MTNRITTTNISNESELALLKVQLLLSRIRSYKFQRVIKACHKGSSKEVNLWSKKIAKTIQYDIGFKYFFRNVRSHMHTHITLFSKSDDGVHDAKSLILESKIKQIHNKHSSIGNFKHKRKQ